MYGHHSNQTSSGMNTETMCAYPPPQHAFTHWKYVIRCSANCQHIYPPSQELDKHH